MDNVLNLSAFGEIIPGKKGEKEDITFKSFMKEPERENIDTSDVPKDDRPENAVSFVAMKSLVHSSQIKLLHWQTKSYAEHKALDKLFNGIIVFQDDLVETIMGKYGRPKILEDSQMLTIYNYDECDCSEAIEKMKNCYSKECKSYFTAEEDPEILNILDEIIALLDKTMYLLTLK
jgi:hypothetical protein